MAAVKKDVTSERIAAFPTLPDDALIDPRTAAGLFSFSVETLKRRVRDGLIPRPIALNSNTHRWRAGDIRRELARLATANQT